MIEDTRENIITRIDPKYLTERMINRMRRADIVQAIPMDEEHKNLLEEFNKKFKGVREDNFLGVTSIVLDGSSVGFMTKIPIELIRVENEKITFVYILKWDSVMIINETNNSVSFVLNNNERFIIQGGQEEAL